MKIKINYLILFFFISSMIFSQNVIAQKIEIPLTERVVIDDYGYHVMPFMTNPKRNLKLPALNLSKAMYFDLLYNWFPDSVNWNLITQVMVVPEKDGERLYVDYNADNDLTNEGSPLFFSFNDDKICIDISAPNNKGQFVRYSFCRKPKPEDTSTTNWIEKMFDKNGNLIQSITMVFGTSHEGFTGAKGTFYFDESINLAKGKIRIDRKNYAIGLYDYNLNGLFNNEKDLLLIDINNDGKLESTCDAFKLNDVFELEGKHFKLDFIDPYGRNLTLVETNEESTLYYLKEFQTQSIKGVTKGNLDSLFWLLEYKTLSGNKVKMNTFKGKYLLLNFWGEWCGPCLAEISGLVDGYKKFPREKLEIISFLNTKELEKAKKIIKEKEMLWPQIKITDKIDEKFRVRGWPTNILIYPDGINYLQVGSIYRTFFDEYIKWFGLKFNLRLLF